MRLRTPPVAGVFVRCPVGGEVASDSVNTPCRCTMNAFSLRLVRFPAVISRDRRRADTRTDNPPRPHRPPVRSLLANSRRSPPPMHPRSFGQDTSVTSTEAWKRHGRAPTGHRAKHGRRWSASSSPDGRGEEAVLLTGHRAQHGRREVALRAACPINDAPQRHPQADPHAEREEYDEGSTGGASGTRRRA